MCEVTFVFPLYIVNTVVLAIHYRLHYIRYHCKTDPLSKLNSDIESVKMYARNMVSQLINDLPYFGHNL